MQVAWQNYLLQVETALEEERILLDHALHERAVAVWLAAETYAESPHDAPSRGAYVQAAGMAHGAFVQAVGQSHGTCSQALGQHWGTLQQSRGTALGAVQQSLAQAWQTFAQTMPPYEQEPAALDLTDLVEPPAEERQRWETAQKELDEALKQAREKYREALAQATAEWKQAVAQEGARRVLDQDEASAALRRANRRWLADALSALEDLRAAFRLAQRKYQLQMEG